MRESLVAHEGNQASGIFHLPEAYVPAQSMATPAQETQRDRVITWLKKHVPEVRLQHILRVEATAAQLAFHHSLDSEKAAQAGLMHDLAKYFKPKRLLQMAQDGGVEVDPVAMANPHLLHAEVGAIVARQEFGVEDEEILHAIADHTLGRPGMAPLSCVVFLADSLEPGRGNQPELEELRHWSQKDLFEAVWRTCDYTLRHLVMSRHLIHPRVVLTRNSFLQRASKQRQSLY